MKAHSQSTDSYTGPNKWFGLESKKIQDEDKSIRAGSGFHGYNDNASQMSSGEKSGSVRSLGMKERERETQRQREKDAERSLGNSRNRFREYRAMSQRNSSRGTPGSSRDEVGYAEQKDTYDTHGIHLSGDDRESVIALSRTHSIDYDKNLSVLPSSAPVDDHQPHQPLYLSIPEVEARVLNSLSARRLYKCPPYQSPYGPEQIDAAFRYVDQSPQTVGADVPYATTATSSPSSLQVSSAPSPLLPPPYSEMPFTTFQQNPPLISHPLPATAPKSTSIKAPVKAVPIEVPHKQAKVQAQQLNSNLKAPKVVAITTAYLTPSSIAHSVPHSSVTSIASERYIYPQSRIHDNHQSQRQDLGQDQDMFQVQVQAQDRQRSGSLLTTKASKSSVSAQPSPARSMSQTSAPAFSAIPSTVYSVHCPAEHVLEGLPVDVETQEERQLSDYLRWLGTQSQPVKSNGEMSVDMHNNSHSAVGLFFNQLVVCSQVFHSFYFLSLACVFVWIPYFPTPAY